jgi:protein-S-isoprenylcysteine O-methyltransferase Ste14
MNAEPSTERTIEKPDVKGAVGIWPLLRFAMFAVLVPGVLFLAAGTFKWRWAWLYYALLVLSTVVSRALMIRQHPDLLAERVQYREKADAKGWDRVLVNVVALYGPLATWIVAGLDFRYGGSPVVAPALRWASAAIVALGMAFASWAMVVNRFFAAVVRIQDDRGHEVVSDGPYRLMRHPGYAGGVWAWLVTPLMLGALWAYVPALLTVAVMCVRTALEDRTLIAELAGYDAYARRTRYRLLPGIW